eukprot:scaffold84718_cov15-Tisochrysis_lutea.AAC.2
MAMDKWFPSQAEWEHVSWCQNCLPQLLSGLEKPAGMSFNGVPALGSASCKTSPAMNPGAQLRKRCGSQRSQACSTRCTRVKGRSSR